MDVAASEFYKDGKYDLDFKSPDDPSRYISPDKLADIYKGFVKDYPGELLTRTLIYTLLFVSCLLLPTMVDCKKLQISIQYSRKKANTKDSVKETLILSSGAVQPHKLTRTQMCIFGSLSTGSFFSGKKSKN